jgi:hypothetical protein
MSERERYRNGVLDSVTLPGAANNATGYDGSGHTLAWPTQANKLWNLATFSEYSQDTVTPKWKELIAAGAIINNHYRRSKTTITGPTPDEFIEHYKYPSVNDLQCSTHSTKHPIYSKCKGYHATAPADVFLTPDVGVRSALATQVANLAVVQARANISEADLLAYATAAESRKTVESVLSILSRVRGIAKAVRRLDGRRLRRELSFNELQDRYMEYRYAIRPLYYDATGLLAALEKQRGHIRQTYKGYAQDSMSDSYTGPDISVYKSHIRGNWNKKYSYTVSARAGELCDVTIEAMTPWGADRLPEAIWELLPFSFIVDWFCNLGDIVAARAPKAGVNQLASWVTVKETLTSESWLSNVRSTWPTVSNGGTVIQFTAGDSYQKREELVLERMVNPTPSFVPQVDINLDAWKVADLAIILRKVLR